QQRLDEQRTGGADRGGALATPGGGLQKEGEFLRGAGGDQGPALAGGSTAMSRDQSVIVKELDLAPGGAHPEPLAEQAMGRGVVGSIEDDVAVGVELGLLPLGELPGGERQREQRRTLKAIEDLEGDLL